MMLRVQIPPPALKQDPFAEGKPFEVVWKLKSEGRKESTLVPMLKRLKFLAKHSDLNNPEKIKEFIANQPYSDGYKDNLIDAYSHYARFNGIQWIKPKYMREERITRIPKEEDLNKIISHAKLRYAVAYSMMRDCGFRPVELGMLKVKDIDLETGEVYPITAKHGAGRVLKVRQSTLTMLKKFITESNSSPMDVLWNAKRFKENWSRLKSIVSKKLGEPQLAMIRLYDLRHYAGSMAYYKTKDIIFTMRFLGHKNIKNTLRYVHLINFDKEEYICKVAKSIEEASSLIEQGFEYVTEMKGIPLYRKRK